MSARNGTTTARARTHGAQSNGAAATSLALAVRPAGETDLVPLNFFFDSVLRRDYFMRRGQLEELVRGPHHEVLIAEIDDVLVGVAITTRGSRLVNALVHPAYRGLGIGRALVRRSGATEVRAKTDMSTGDPRGFYRALGFRSTGQSNGKGNIKLMKRAKRTAAKSANRNGAGASANGQARRSNSTETNKRTQKVRNQP